MTIRNVVAPNEEPDVSNFPLPSEGTVHLFQVTDKWEDKNNPDRTIAKCEVAEGDELGRSLLNGVLLDPSQKGFYYSRLFLKAINEPYKGEFSINDDNWIGRFFRASVVHSGKYANIDEYDFDTPVEQPAMESSESKKPDEEIAWDN